MLYSSGVDVFRAVVRQGSFVGAAQELGISGAAVSKQIKRLEQRLNLVLFYRTTRSVVPTEAAQRLAAQLFRSDDEFDTLLNQLSDAQLSPSGRLRVNVPMSFGELFLRRSIRRLSSMWILTIDASISSRTGMIWWFGSAYWKIRA